MCLNCGKRNGSEDSIRAVIQLALKPKQDLQLPIIKVRMLPIRAATNDFCLNGPVGCGSRRARGNLGSVCCSLNDLYL